MLTPAERREKKLEKLVGEKGPDTLVAVYKVRMLRRHCNASQSHLSVGRSNSSRLLGCTPDC